MEIGAAGRLLLVIGMVVVGIGLLLIILDRTPAGAWLANLPGTLRVQGQGFSCLIPIAASIILSIVLTIVLNLVLRWLNRP